MIRGGVMTAKAIAAVVTSPGVVEIQQFTVPAVSEDDAIVRIEASGICGTDYEMFSGDLATPYPIILGHEPLGIIQEIGPEASRRWGVSEGDRVAIYTSYRCGRCDACVGTNSELCPNKGKFGFTTAGRPPALWGGNAELMYLPPGSVVYPIEKSLPSELAVLFNPLAGAFNWAVDAPGLQRGDSIAILGPGQRGLCSIIAAREAGASKVIITGIGRDDHKLALARDLGANLTINVEQDDPVSMVMEATNGVGVDVVLDVSAYSVDPVVQAVRMVKKQGTVILAGLKGRRPLVGFSTDEIVWKQVTMKGVLSVTFSSFERAIEIIQSRRYPLEKLHTHSFPVEETETALKTLSGEVGVGAINVSITPTSRSD